MRLLLAILAVLGLLLAPAAAAAGTAACAHHGAEGMVMTTDAPHSADSSMAADHSCCDEDQQAPPKHDDKACAQACALMCLSPAALAKFSPFPMTAAGHLVLEATPLKAFHAHAPPGLKRPPRTFA